MVSYQGLIIITLCLIGILVILILLLFKKEATISVLEKTLKSSEKDLQLLKREEKEKIEKAVRHFNKSVEYRIILQDYQKKLKIWTDDLDKRERDLLEISHNIEEQKKSITNIEYNAQITINRWEKKEREYLEELTASYEKIINNPQIAKKKTGYRFEEHVAKLLQANGYENVLVTKASGDFGGDVIAEKNSIKYVFQCKYYSKAVGVHAIQEVLAAIKPYKADKGIVVTNNVFTTPAKQLAKDNDIILWDCSDIARLNMGLDIF